MPTLSRHEMDRITTDSLQYLTTVRPHFINREPFLVDEFVYDTLSQIYGLDVIEEFGDYTRSLYTLEGHYHNLWLYDRPILPKPQDPLLDMAISKAYATFKLEQPVYSISWSDLASVPFIPSSSAGWGYTGRKGDPGNHDRAIHYAVLSLNWWLDDLENHTNEFLYHPDLAWTRTQLGTVEDPKIRNVWGTSFDNIIIEGMTAAPLIDAFRQRGYPIPLGVNYFKRLPSIINRALFDGSTYNYGVGIDFKSFDASIQPWLIDVCFDILKQNIIFRDVMGQHSFDYSKHFFVHRPVVMPDGRMWLKHLGIPSGSYFTQLVGSIANYITITYAQFCHYGQSFETHVLGDDSLFGVPVDFGRPKFEYFIPAAHRLGLTIHSNKGVIAVAPEELEFLGHCARHIRVSREDAGLMRLALYPEHPVRGPAHSLTRIKGLLLDSAANSWPLIHLHDTMMTRWRNELNEENDIFIHDNKDWLVSVLGIPDPPSTINSLTAFTLT